MNRQVLHNIFVIISLCALATVSYIRYDLMGVAAVTVGVAIFLAVIGIEYFTGNDAARRVIRRCFLLK